MNYNLRLVYRKRKHLTGFLFAFYGFLLTSFSAKAQPDAILPRPKLVVGIVVDQMRWDYLYRFYDKYGSGGFKRLMNEGFSCENMMINYLPSATAVGHSTIYTGSVPSIDGIAGNGWIDQLTGRKQYVTEDSSAQTVGSNSNAGKASPRNLLVTTITDELRLASNFRSKVVGISLKDRAAILPAGHSANAAFWLDDKESHFISSSYYMKSLPDWVNKFNEKELPEKMIAGGWKTLLPLKDYTESSPDSAGWEQNLGSKAVSVFPYENLADDYKKQHDIIRYTPFGNTLTLDFAKAAIEGYRLGMEQTSDFLTINCASTDYASHRFGPNSVEVEDVYLRLDRDLATFFQYLDKKIGKGNYLVFLSADHGGAHAKGFMEAHQLPSGIWDRGIIQNLNDFLASKTGVAQLVRKDGAVAASYQINYDMNRIAENQLNLNSIKKATVAFLRKQPGVLYAVDVEQIGSAPIPFRIKEMIINGYSYQRSGPVQIIPMAGWLPEFAAKGTTHGGWNPYDTHIPLLFMGWHIKHGKTNHTLYMTDIAPTIASLLHIQMPSGSIGSPIEAILNN